MKRDARVHVRAPARARGSPWARPSPAAVVMAVQAPAGAVRVQATDSHAVQQGPVVTVVAPVTAGGGPVPAGPAASEPAARGGPSLVAAQQRRELTQDLHQRPVVEREPLVSADQLELRAGRLLPAGGGSSATVPRRAHACAAMPPMRQSAGRTESLPATARRTRLRPPQGVTRLWGPPHLSRPSG